MSTFLDKLSRKWKELEGANLTEDELLKELLSEENEEKKDKKETPTLETFEEDYTDKMVINGLKDDFFNIYIMLEMENILMGRFLYESMDAQEKVKKVSDLFCDIAGDLYTKWEKKFGTDLDGRR